MRNKKPIFFKKAAEMRTAQASLRALPIPALVGTIDTMIGILRERGVVIRDWDDREKVVHRMKLIGNQVFILAPREKREKELIKNGNGNLQEKV